MKAAVYYRVDGGARLGMGHLFKAAILTDRLRKVLPGLKIRFLIRQDSSAVKWLKRLKYPVIRIPYSVSREKETDWIRAKLGKGNGNLFVLDILDVSRPYVAAVKRLGYKVMAFENLATSQRIADVTVNALVQGLENRIEKFPEGGILYRGAKYRIFHKDYSKYRKKESAQKGKDRILITLGGGSDSRFSEIMIDEILKRFKPENIACIQGPAQKQPVRKRKGWGASVRLLKPQPSLARAMKEADFAVTAGGGTLHELAFQGVPAVAFSKKKHQIRNIRMFEKKGTVIYAGNLQRKNARKAAWILEKLARNSKLRQNMIQSGRLLEDGKGTDRVITIIKSLLKGA